jgi:hypothetical protein
MTRAPVDWFVVFVWTVRAFAVGVLVALLFACITNSVTMATNPACVISCTADAPRPAASSVTIEQNISNERAPNANPYR